MLKLVFAFATLGLAWLLSDTASAGDATLGSLQISNPYVRAMVPGARVGGGYMTIINSGPTDDRLTAVSSSRAGTVQIHEMKMDNAVMIMRELPNGLPIPAGEKIELKPGGDHVMFTKIGEPFREGQVVKTTLTFEKAGSVDVDFPVGSAVGGKVGDHQDMGAMKGMQGMAEPQKDIPAIMKAMFQTPEKPLAVAPVVVHGDWAVAGWVQDGRGGRVLLKKRDHGWTVHLCSGDSLKDAAALERIGLPTDDARAIATEIADAEARLDPKTTALFASFEGTVVIDQTAATDAGGNHAGHTK